MKTKRSQRVVIMMIMVLYAFSLSPFFIFSINCDVNLCVAIQQMQRLHQTSNSEQVDFEAALRNSITSLKAIAGISAVIVEKFDESATNQNSFLIVTVKSPHLLSASTGPKVLRLEIQDSFPREEQSYISLNSPPEEPPPNFANC